jgi:PPM family protein phosphatase
VNKNMEETTAEYALDQLAPAVELRFKTRTTVAAKTDLGRVRENNEDKFEYYVTEDPRLLASKGHIYVVCDGMGGHEAGQIASELTCKTFIDVYLNHPSNDPFVALTAAVVASNRFVLDNARTFPKRRGMGTTLTGLILLQDQAYAVNVGDSRVYRMRDGELTRLTMDHTVIEEYVKLGMLTVEQAAVHPQKHVLTRAVGGEPDVKPDVDMYDLKAGDTYLLCSDGVINHVEDPQIGDLLRAKAPAEAAWSIVGQALQGGGSDNTTVLVVRVDELSPVQP